MEDEVKRACISVLTEQHFDLFDAIDADASGLPQLEFPEARAEGAYVRFFEQAFEWENLSWVPYSYFWGRKSTWLDKVAIEDDDADFQAFLKAGYLASRSRSGPASPTPSITSACTARSGAAGRCRPSPTTSTCRSPPRSPRSSAGPATRSPVGEPWEVRVATTLVKLRADDKLPSWTKQPDGTWVPN